MFCLIHKRLKHTEVKTDVMTEEKLVAHHVQLTHRSDGTKHEQLILVLMVIKCSQSLLRQLGQMALRDGEVCPAHQSQSGRSFQY